jgi:hypothetical protein
VDLFADAKELSQAGFALNGLIFEGFRSLEDLKGKTLSLGPERDDHFNELAESVICKPGEVLEIDTLRLKFGRSAKGLLPVAIKATCHGVAEAKLYVSASVNFSAKVKIPPT